MDKVEPPQERHVCWTHSLTHTHGDPDDALMGTAHAASGLAAFIAVLAFGSTFSALFIPGNPTIGQYALAGLAFIAGALIPDFDNTSSTAKSAMGVFGEPITFMFRESSRLVQNIHTKQDAKSRAKAHDTVHRGFWHSLIGAVALGLIVNLIINNPITNNILVPLGFVGIKNLSTLIAAVTCLAAMHIAVSGLNLGALKAMKGAKGVSSTITFIVSVAVTLLFFSTADANGYTWLGYSLTAGAIVHIIGDAFTKAGVPLFAPIIPRKGKLWYTYRFATFEAKSDALNSGVIWGSVAVIIISLITLLQH